MSMNTTSSWWTTDPLELLNDVGNGSSIITNGSMNGDGELTSSILPDEADPAFVRFRDESRFWIQRVLLPIIGTIGVFGNIATILVLTRRGMRTSTNAYLTALAVADLIYLICVFWLSLRHYPNVKEDPIWSTIYSHAWPYSLWLTDATTNTSVWLTVTFTVERYIAVAHPIKGRIICTESRARKVICAVYVICFTATMTTPFEWTVVELTDPATNITKVEIAPSDLGNDETYQTIYYWFTSITFVLLPLALLIVFNSFLIHSVRDSQKLRRVMTARQTVSDREERAATHEIKITTTLIAVVIMFLVCQLPTAATLIYKIFHEPKPDEEAILRALGNIFNCLVSLNAACNFLLYCALSDKYRRTFMWTFCRCLYRPSSPVHSMAFFTQSEGADGSQYSRHASFVNRGDRASMSVRRVSTQRRSSGLQRIPSAPATTRRNHSYLALPAAGNGSTVNSPSMNSNRAATSQRHPSVVIASPSSPQSRVSLVKRNTVTLKNRSGDPSVSSPPSSRWPNFWPWRRSPSSKTPVESESTRIQIPSNDEATASSTQRLDGEDVAFV